ncbi:Tyrosyl-DNA phosphodiesterase 1, partial [Linum perenne]
FDTQLFYFRFNGGVTKQPKTSRRQWRNHRKIGYLVPLKSTLDEVDTSLPKLPLAEGSNSIGRETLSLSDKRISRNHLTLTITSTGSAHLSVDGTNPVVVKSGDRREKLSRGEKKLIRNGDVIELIPGHHFFKYLPAGGGGASSSSFPKRASNGGNDPESKRIRHSSFATTSSNGNVEEPIRDFRIPEDKLPHTFRLLKVKELPQWANTSAVTITDVIQGDIQVAILSNYMVDMDWLMSACPALAKVPQVLVLHGEGDGRVEMIKRSKPANWILHKPPLPISFGTHHSKAMFLVYPKGVRVIVHTANLIYVDWNNKTQGLWMQDFPWKDEKNGDRGCGFEGDLVDYLGALKWPEFTASLPSVGSFKINASFFKKFDYTDARVRLIASVPGYHTGPNMKKWGHLKLKAILQECVFDKEFKSSPLIYQFSSLGSLDEKWMTELATSMSSGVTEDKQPLGLGVPRIIWPTVEDVRCSIEGYAAGNAVPSPLKNVEKEFLKKYWAKWKATHTGRCRAMPHIKTFARYSGQRLAWFLLTSSNLSKAAWGALQKNNSQLMIRSYELGVLFLPSQAKQQPGRAFSCTSNRISSQDNESRSSPRTELVTLSWQRTEDLSSSQVVRLPVPYELPPQPYAREDVPWSWDRKYSKKDVYGQVWPS